MMLQVPGNHPELHEILVLHTRLEQLREYRTVLLHVLAIAGGLCWMRADFPAAMPRVWSLAVVAGWPAAFAAFLLFLTLEIRVGSRLRSLIGRRNGSRGSFSPPGDDEPSQHSSVQ
jgi:hypothetical protein